MPKLNIKSDERSLAVFSQAVEVANTVTEPAKKANALIYIAVQYAQIDHHEQAQQLLSQALNIALMIKDKNQKDNLLQ